MTMEIIEIYPLALKNLITNGENIQIWMIYGALLHQF